MKLQQFGKIGVILLTALIVAQLFPGQILAATTEEKSWKFERWQTDLDIQPDGQVNVTEDTQVQFTGAFSWYSRVIPVQGRMRISNVRVFEGPTDITSEFATIDTSDPAKVEITIAQASTDVTRNYRITYTASRVIGLFSDYDELYWNAISDDRDVPIDELRVYVHFPEPITDGVVSRRMYVGYYGATDTGGTNRLIDDRTVEYYLANVEPYTNATTVTTFPKGIVPDSARVVLEYPDSEVVGTAWAVDGEQKEYAFFGNLAFIGSGVNEIPPSTQLVRIERWGYKTFQYAIDPPTEGQVIVPITFEATWWYKALGFILLIALGVYVISPFGVFIWLFLRWQRMGKDPAGRGTIIPEYDPYKQANGKVMTPAMVGALRDERVDMVDITASIVDLAIRGYIRIIEDDASDISFERTVKPTDDLREFELELLRAIFGNDITGSVTLDSLKYHFQAKLAGIRSAIQSELTADGFFEANPETVRKKYGIIGVVCIVIGVIGASFYGIGIPLFLIGLLFALFSRWMPKRTKLGVEVKEWHEGYKMYLHHAERYRLQKMTTTTFEAALPYAMVFGVEKEWAKQFTDIYATPPSWYSSPQLAGNFTMLQLVSNLDTAVMPAMQTTLSATQSSNGSAASGASGFSGGFSGGGFGGGGSSAG